MSDLIGTQLGHYQITDIISHGGTATVYKARQMSLGRHVAVKVMYRSRDPQFAARFAREARVIAQLQHPNILPIYESGEQDGLLYLVLRYIEGGATLHDQLDQPIEPLRALRMCALVLDGLEYAHAHGIVHRDVKPANILMSGPDWPLLADFGIAKLSSEDLHLTHTGLIIGTAAYMSPEQASGDTVDARSDVYAMGVVLYEMLTGRLPFEGTNAMAVLNKHVHAPPPSPRQFVPALTADVEAVLLRALAKKPSERYQTAAAMATELRRLATLAADVTAYAMQPIPVLPVLAPVSEVPKRRLRLAPPWTSLTIAAVLLSGGGGLGWLGYTNAAAQQPAATAISLPMPSATATSTKATSAPTPSATATSGPTLSATATSAPTPSATATS
ncbi:MAG: protein kinase, partial [Roseiflexaceae bacterium]|nr:protein kinase [Roseiflexaceae bacterium]